MTAQPAPVSRSELARFSRALPFGVSLLLIPLIWFGATTGGWALALVPVATWYLFTLLDLLVGLDQNNADPAATPRDLFWYRALTLIWAPVQFVTLFGLIWYTAHADHLSGFEQIALFFGLGVLTGTIGINYSHELMHQRHRAERFCADMLLAMVLYSHFRSEHLLVHHRHVGTPKDTVTARYNEGFHRFYPRVLIGSLRSAFRAEAAMLARKNLPWHSLQNPFFKYWTFQGACLILAIILGGWSGLGLFIFQAGVAVWQLELVNYIEHYGLTRRRLENGKFEHVQPHHSWNASHKASNWLLINLQRHSDHHYKPDRPFPVLQTYDAQDAPQLPFGYPLMTMAAMVPPLWRRIMNPKVRAWRKQYYPDITDWTPYTKMTPLADS